MSIQTYLLCLLAGLAGLLFNLFAVKIPSVKTRASVANMPPFSYKQYFQDDATAIISSFLALVIYLFVLKDILLWRPELVPYVVALSVFIGYTGSSLLLSALGQAQSKINAVVDLKTNVADNLPTEPNLVELPPGEQ